VTAEGRQDLVQEVDVKSDREAGFSLIELMVAMVITVIITGAIYGLLASGQSAFRREPALVDRQQNIRIAMELITRDVQNAGAGMLPFTQVFTDDNPPNSMWNPNGGTVSSEIVPGEKADYLEMLVNDGSCPALAVCGSPGGSIFTFAPLPACIFGDPPKAGFAYVAGAGGPATSASNKPGLLWINVPGPGGGGSCGGGNVNLPAGQGAGYNPGGNQACGPGGTANTTSNVCESIAKIQYVRYELAPQNPGAAVHRVTNPPSLWRSELGRNNDDGSISNGPHTGLNSAWVLVARGIDDMKIEYFHNGVWNNTAGQVTADLNTVVTEVRVRLSAYAIGGNMGGETVYAPGGTAARRGQLTTTIAPRAALIAKSSGAQWR
jgi:prepilin-type N-terminal cleavage/methylation domain-containing protein